jgi:NADPH:quinone reductase-like Zn-dependent oxidoreductase
MLVTEVSRFGGPEVLTPRRVPDPGAGPRQVVIQAAAADVLLVDAMIRSGRGMGFFPDPAALHTGHVIATGDDVDPSWAGRGVVAHTGSSGGSGGYAERAVVPAADLIPVPPGLTRPAAGSRCTGSSRTSPPCSVALAAAALAEAAAGRLRPVIGQTFPLDLAADAHAALEARTALAKTLLLTR